MIKGSYPRYYSIIDGKTFVNFGVYTEMNGKVIFNDSCVGHNFSPFVDTDGTLYGVGGQDSWKHDFPWYSMKTFEQYRDYFEKRFNRKYEGTPAKVKQALFNVSKWDRKPLTHSFGLYLFKYNGKTFEEVQKEPIITPNHPGFVSSLGWKSSEFDGHLWLAKLEDTYFLFCCENTGPGFRSVQFTTSKDLITWGEFKTVNLPFDEEINTYFMVGGQYEDGFLCFLPQFDSVNGWVSFYFTKDFQAFDFLKDMFKKPLVNQRNQDHPVNGITRNKFAIHHKYRQKGAFVEHYDISRIFKK